MKLALFGASGMIGQRILGEAIRRGHEVTAIVRDPKKIAERNPKLKVVEGNVLDAGSVAKVVAGHDAVIDAFGPGPSGPWQAVVDAARVLIEALPKGKVKRLLFVGGAGSLEVSPGVDLIDAGKVPEEWKPPAIAHRDALKLLKKEGGDLEWTYFSPAAFIQPGERTGKFRVGGDQLLTDAKGESRISAEDFAIALLDEAEKPQHLRKRITVAY